MSDITDLQRWIGGTETAEDLITPRLLREYTATLGYPSKPNTMPLALHWCLAPPAASAAALGSDGHPARGSFLPPVPLPRRMWAGGALRLHDQVRVGEVVTRHSRIVSVTMKEGRSGSLCFVTVVHEIAGPRGIVISETQDIVYRESASPVAKPERAVQAEVPAARWMRAMAVDPVMLFRFSALTFNGHRIHYDRDYAMKIEHYGGLVVHGPLQATWLLEFAADILGRPPNLFTFRSVQPLLDFQKAHICAEKEGDRLKLWVQGDSARTMEASAA